MRCYDCLGEGYLQCGVCEGSGADCCACGRGQCEACDGLGDGEKCPACDGTGETPEAETEVAG